MTENKIEEAINDKSLIKLTPRPELSLNPTLLKNLRYFNIFLRIVINFNGFSDYEVRLTLEKTDIIKIPPYERFFFQFFRKDQAKGKPLF